MWKNSKQGWMLKFYTSEYSSLYECMDAGMPVRTYVHVCVCVCVCVCLYVSVCMCIYMCVYIYIYIFFCDLLLGMLHCTQQYYMPY